MDWKRSAFSLLVMIIGCISGYTPDSSGLRIVSLAPSVTEILFALGLGDRVVGVTRFCDYPKEVKRLPRIGGYVDPDIERILALRPDTVIGVSNVAEQREVCKVLKGRGIRVLLIKEGGIEKLYDSVRLIGSLCGVSETASELIKRVEDGLQRVRIRAKGRRRIRVLFLCGVDPLVGVGRGSFINELMEIAGAENALTVERGYVRLDIERVVKARPDVIIETVMGTEKRMKDFWNRYEELVPAVKNGRIYSVDESLFTRCGPRVVNAAEELFRVIHHGE